MRWFQVFVTASTALLGAFLYAGCGSTGWEPGTTSQALSLCLGPGEGGTLPQNASFPIGNQHVWCQHQPTAFPPASWAPNVSPCTGNANGGQIPGEGQVDVWVRDALTSGTHFYCARISIPLPGHFSLDYVGVMRMGWFASFADAPRHLWIQGIMVGPGVAGYLSSLADVWNQTCAGTPVPCVLFRNYTGDPAYWLQVDTTLITMSLNLYQIGMRP